MEPFENLMYLFSSAVENRGIVRLNLKEAALLYKIAKKCQGNIVEIGRKYGGSALLLASAIEDGRVYSIDIVNSKYLKHNFSLAPKNIVDKIEVIKSSSFDYSQTWDKPIQMIFIDGDHSVKGLKLDVKCWLPHVVPGGYAAFHDIVNAGIGLEVVTDRLQTEGWEKVDSADTLLVLKKPFLLSN